MGDITLKQITKANQIDVFKMETGLKEDYVLRILPQLIENEPVYGAYRNDELVAIAGYTLFANSFAILGRLRTAMAYRGNGIATQLLQKVMKIAIEKHSIDWIGLTTLDDNLPVHHIAKNLGMAHMTSYYSCTLRPQKLNKKETDDHNWKIVSGLEKKRWYINKFLPTATENVLGMFPYEAYYPIIQSQKLITDKYLERCYMFINTDKHKFILLMPDHKDKPYFHVKYFWDDFFDHELLIEQLYLLACHHQRYLWIDLAESTYQKRPKEFFDNVSKWRLYGKSMDQPILR